MLRLRALIDPDGNAAVFCGDRRDQSRSVPQVLYGYAGLEGCLLASAAFSINAQCASSRRRLIAARRAFWLAPRK